MSALQDLAGRSGIQVERLAQTELPEAQRLLHDIYHLEQGWNPVAGNASNVRVENRLLRDDYEKSSIYIGARETGTGDLVGVSRILPPTMETLEVCMYGPNFSIPEGALVCEINRHAVRKDWRSRGPIHYLIAHMVLTATIEWDAQMVLGAVQADQAETLANRFHGHVLPGAEVQYEENDEHRRLVVFSDSMSYRLATLNTLTSFEEGWEVADSK